jgi:arsenate reductase
MAEGLLRAKHGDRFLAYSAGVSPTSVDPCAIKAMKEIGIDISQHHSKSVSELLDLTFDLAVTVCDQAKESCPIVVSGSKQTGSYPKSRLVIHHSFADPADVSGSEEERLLAFRRTRDEISEWISKTLSKYFV